MVSEQLTRVLRQIHHLAAGLRAGEWSDGQALGRFVAAREEAAFCALVQRHGPLVWGVCRRILKHIQDAEDAFQATFLVLAQRAGSIRKPESVGSWLYGVAYHIALEARNRQVRRGTRERQVENMPHPPSPADTSWAQLEPVLDEELHRLPEKYRRPLVLCYLEGKSYRETAEELGWPLGSTSKRLARARELLRRRLTRRGVTLSAGILSAALTNRAAPAAPAALVHAAVKAGLLLVAGKPFADVVSAHALSLFQKAPQGMFLTKLKIATALVLLLGGLGLGTLALPAVGKQAGARAEDRSPEPTKSKADRQPLAKQDKEQSARSRPETAEKLTVAGRVEDQTRKPVADAQVGVLVWPAGTMTPDKPLLLGQTKTDARGRYRLQVKKPSPAQQVATLVKAPGFGLAWNYLAAPSGTVIRLAPEQVLRVRLIDLQGQSAAGVKVHVCRVGNPPPAPVEHHELFKLLDTVDGAIDSIGIFSLPSLSMGGTKPPIMPKLAALRFRDPPGRLPVWPGPVTTDARGRFTLRGLPPGQGLALLVRDARFALQALAIKAQPRAKPPEITLVLAQARVIEGTVVDAATGKPVPGALVHVPTRAAGYYDATEGAAPSHPSIGEADWKGRRGVNGYRIRSVLVQTSPALIEHLRKYPLFPPDKRSMEMSDEVPAPDELPRIDARADQNGRYRLPLFVADSYNVTVSGPGTGSYFGMSQTVSWTRKAKARHQLKLSLSRGVWVKGVVTETPSGKPVAGARVDFWSPELVLPAGVSFPAPLITGHDGRFQALLLPGSWHLLVNCSGRIFVHQKIAAARLTGKRATRITIPDGYDSIVTSKPRGKDHFLYPDGWAALNLKPQSGPLEVAVKLQTATLRGKLLGPDGKPVARAVMFYRHPMPAYRGADSRDDLYQIVWKIRCPVRGEPAVAPVEVKGGKFELPLVDVGAKYRLYFLDIQNQWGAVAEVRGRDKSPIIKMAPCGSAKARLTDAKGKPRAGYQPLLWMLLPLGPHPVMRHSAWEFFTPDVPAARIPAIANFQTPPPGSNKLFLGKVWWASADPRHYGKGFQTDARGNISFPVLIPGATYRIFDPDGRAKDFTVEAGKKRDLGEVTVK
jgi:RNA polymerase sigma factor (sigma-70 family)